MRNRIQASLFSLLGLAACSTDNTGLNDVPIITKMPPRAIVALSDVVNNIKCDMQKFLDANEIVTGRARSIGGILTFTLDRSNESGAGLKVGIPVATGIKLDAGVSGSNKASFGEVVTTPFVIHMGDGSVADCSNSEELSVYIPGNPQIKHVKISKPILNLTDLKDELKNITPGEPKIAFGDFQFAGSIAFTRSSEASLDINIIILNPSISDKVSADFKIDYKIGTNWVSILKEAKFSLEDPFVTLPKLVPAKPVVPAKPPKASPPDDSPTGSVTHPLVPT